MSAQGPSSPADIPPGQKIVVFTGNLNYGVRKGIVAIDEAVPGLQWLVCVQRPRRTLASIWTGQRKNIRRHGWRWLTYQLGEMLRRTLSSGEPVEPVAPTPGHAYTQRALCARPNIRIQHVERLHQPELIESVRSFRADLGLSIGGPILKRELFALPRLGTINLHKGKLPNFRGMPPAFWELWHDQDRVGCSVHIVDDGLDTGAILGEAEVLRQRWSTLRSLQLQLDEVAIGLTRDCVKAVLEGAACPRPQPTSGGRTFRSPTLAEQQVLRKKLAIHSPWALRLKEFLKDCFAFTLIAAYRLGARHLIRPRVSIFCYHRVCDDARDNLSISIELFDHHMQWLAAHCQVVSIEEVLRMDRIPRTARPLVAITFDDGYADNCVHAAPILQRHGLPAAFFVSTGIVHSDRPFPHDVRRGNPPIAKMTWGQIQEMHRQGFVIGSHTVNHIDCAGEPPEVVKRELAQSRDALRDQLGVTKPIFAYPYGGRRHMTAQAMQWVKDAGYVGMLAAHGGTNAGSVDRFMVMRCSDGWGFSDLAFRRLSLGLV